MGPAGTSGVSLNQWWTDGRTFVSGSIEPLVVVFTPLPPTTLTTAARNHLIVTAGGVTAITIIITE